MKTKSLIVPFIALVTAAMLLAFAAFNPPSNLNSGSSVAIAATPVPAGQVSQLIASPCPSGTPGPAAAVQSGGGDNAYAGTVTLVYSCGAIANAPFYGARIAAPR